MAFERDEEAIDALIPACKGHGFHLEVRIAKEGFGLFHSRCPQHLARSLAHTIDEGLVKCAAGHPDIAGDHVNVDAFTEMTGNKSQGFCKLLMTYCRDVRALARVEACRRDSDRMRGKLSPPHDPVQPRRALIAEFLEIEIHRGD